jgi:hypothetical protein
MKKEEKEEEKDMRNQKETRRPTPEVKSIVSNRTARAGKVGAVVIMTI